MIRQIFIINLINALKHNKKSFNSPYNYEVMKLIPLLVKFNVILHISKNNILKKDRLIIYMNINLKSTNKITIVNMCSRKKIRNWPVSVLIDNAQRNQTYILKTIFGYKDSSFCIKNRIGGTTILQIGC